MKVYLQPKQLQLYKATEESAAVWIGIGGSRGGSKSDGGRKVVLLRALKYAKSRHLIFRRKRKDLKENHIDPMMKDFPELAKGMNHSDLVWRLPNGSVIVFGYAEYERDIEDFMGKEYLTVFADEANQMTEKMHVKLSTCVRYSGTGPVPKYICGFNPGNVGHAFLKRIFYDGIYHDNERPQDYYFIHTFGWDNIEWCRTAILADAGLDGKQVDAETWVRLEKQFYALDGSVGGPRFKMFTERTDYGRKLNSLPPSLRIGHLLGQMDKFAGQYFTVFEEYRHVKQARAMPLQDWHPRWISVDWGFNHPSAVYWHAQDDNVTRTYREFVKEGMGPRVLAQEIIDRTEGEKIEALYLSPDAFAKRTAENTIAEQMDGVFRSAKWNISCARADDDRVGGWQLMYQLLDAGEWEIADSCVKLIENIPMFTRDEDDAEDCIKFDGDDPGDSARYGLKSHLKGRRPPTQVQVEQQIQTWMADGRLSDPTSVMMWRRTLELRAKKATESRRFAYKGLHLPRGDSLGFGWSNHP